MNTTHNNKTAKNQTCIKENPIICSQRQNNNKA